MTHTIRQAARQLRRQPAQAISAAAITALCIGSCVAIAGMARAVLFTDWMYREPSRLGVIWHARANVLGYVGVSPGDYVTYRSSRMRTFESVGAVTTRGFNLGSGGAPARVTCARVTEEIFPLLGVMPAHGRWLNEADDRAAGAIVMVSHQLWSTRLGADPSAIEREIVLDGVPRRVVGIMPAGFSFPPDGVQGLLKPDCWVPASFSPAELAIPAFNYVLIGRLAGHASWQEASQDAHGVAQRIWSSYPAAVQSQITLTAHAVPLIESAMPVSTHGRSPLPWPVARLRR